MAEGSIALERGGRVPPQNIDAEESVLGGVLLKNDALDEIEFLVSTDFYREKHRMIFAAMVGLWQDGTPIDLVTLGTALKESGDLDAVGGEAFLAYLAGRVPTAANVVYYGRLVWDKAILRRVIDTATKFACEAYEFDGKALDLVSDFSDAVAELQMGGQSGGVVSASRASDLAREKYREAQQNQAEDGTAGVGLDWGISNLNHAIGKARPGALITVAGGTGHGKSILAGQASLHIGEKLPVIYFTAEMTAEEMADRAACLLESLDHEDVSEARLSVEAAKLYTKALADHAKLKIQYVTRYFHSPQSMVSYAKALTRQSKSASGLVVIDYLQLYASLMSTTKDDQNFTCGQISTLFKGAFKESGWSVLNLCQFTKAGKASETPTISDIYGSNAILNDSNVIAFLLPDPEDKDATRIVPQKNRGRSTLHVRTLYKEFKHMRFSDQSPSVKEFRNDEQGYMNWGDKEERGF